MGDFYELDAGGGHLFDGEGEVVDGEGVALLGEGLEGFEDVAGDGVVFFALFDAEAEVFIDGRDFHAA